MIGFEQISNVLYEYYPLSMSKREFHFRSECLGHYRVMYQEEPEFLRRHIN